MPAFFSSSEMVLLQVVRGLPLLLVPLGAQVSAVSAYAPTSIRRVWPNHLYRLRFRMVPIGSCLVTWRSLLLENFVLPKHSHDFSETGGTKGGKTAKDMAFVPPHLFQNLACPQCVEHCSHIPCSNVETWFCFCIQKACSPTVGFRSAFTHTDHTSTGVPAASCMTEDFPSS